MYSGGMTPRPPFSIAVRSYGVDGGSDRHDFAQLVLPLQGALEMEIAGRGGLVARGQAAFVAPGTDHAQGSGRANRSFILDLDRDAVAPELVERLTAQTYLPLSPAADRLVEFLQLTMADDAATLARWVPLLLDTLTGEAPRPRLRLAALLAAIEAEPGRGWTAAMMADRAGLSTSRLHALFREELDDTPRAWLADLRLRRAREWLATTDLPIAELACRGGYADQSAFTRAMRRATGLTPAAYRRQAREPAHKKR